MHFLRNFIASATMVTSPVMAQQPPPESKVQVVAQPDNAGVRIEEGQSFTLRIHGAWPAPARPAAPLEEPSKVATAPKTLRFAHGAAPAKSSLLRRESYLPWVSAAELRHALPSGLLDALIWVESKYNPMAISPKGAGGLGQLMLPTAHKLGVRNRFDPYDNIDGAARYLRQMLDKFGLVHLAVAAYNAGPGAVTRSKGIPANRETPSYVSQVLTQWSLSGM